MSKPAALTPAQVFDTARMLASGELSPTDIDEDFKSSLKAACDEAARAINEVCGPRREILTRVR